VIWKEIDMSLAYLLLNVTLILNKQDKMATDLIIYTRSDCHSLRAEANWGFRNVRVVRRVLRARARTKSTSRHGQGCQHSYRSS